jgi:hypothetical protein
MKIYIASSWKMEDVLRDLAALLREAGFEVDCFCDSSSGRFVFHWSELVEKEEDLKTIDAINFLKDWRTKKACDEDKKWLDWADACILVLPAGRSAHLEAGYEKGQGKKLFIYGDFIPGEFDVMYGFSDGLFRWHEINQLIEVLKKS